MDDKLLFDDLFILFLAVRTFASDRRSIVAIFSKFILLFDQSTTSSEVSDRDIVEDLKSVLD